MSGNFERQRLLTTTCETQKEVLLLCTLSAELEREAHRAQNTCSVDCSCRSTTVTTTLPSDYCISFVLGYTFYPVMNGLLALCTCFGLCSNRVEFCTCLVLFHDKPSPCNPLRASLFSCCFSVRFLCFACPLQSNDFFVRQLRCFARPACSYSGSPSVKVTVP